MYKHWPLHPPPYLNESLSSWITRIAILYGMQPEELLGYEFGINLGTDDLYSIDLNPSIDFLNQLSERTGVEFNTIRALTAQSYVPLLIDTFESTETNTLNNYTNQLNIFPVRRKNITLNNCIPWFNISRFATVQGCERCLREDQEPYFRLHWRLPWMMSCPKHKLLLERVMVSSLRSQKVYSDNNSSIEHTLDHLCAMDAITLQAVTKGMVKLPSSNLHGGVWLRMLRTLIEELSSLAKIVGSQSRNLIAPFWKELNCTVREGLGRYTVFEQCDYKRQLKLMLVVALVFKAIFAGEMKFSGTDVDLLTPLPIYESDFSSVYSESIDPSLLYKQREIYQTVLLLKSSGSPIITMCSDEIIK